jgi:uncharacterized membrane protein
MLIIMHHIAFCTSMLCTLMSLVHVWLISPISHVYAEPELEVPMEQVQVENFTNLKLTQGKPRCI